MEADFSDPESDLAHLALTAPRGRHILGDPKPGGDARRRLLLFALAIGVASAVLGMLQVLGGGPYFYTITNAGTAVGFAANHNHFAALEYVLLPLGARGAGRNADAISSSLWL